MIWVFAAIAGLLLLAALIPFIPIPHGSVRAFDFPRLQFATLSGIAFVVSAAVLPWNTAKIFVLCISASALLFQLAKIARFTPIWKRRSHTFKGNAEETPVISLLVANVKMGNRDYGQLAELVTREDPDIALFIEVDAKWISGLDQATKQYPHRMECPKDTGYGLLLVSRFKLESQTIKYLLNEEVPSFDAKLRHDSGDVFRLIALHPEPPVLNRDTTYRDGEIAKVAEDVRDYDDALIVTGDLNDVAWSRTTRRFLRLSRLLDPREGRGMFNSFDARYFFVRWPLDHIFHSPHFHLMSIRRLSPVGSDHFPMFYRLALTDQEAGRRETDPANTQDFAEANEVVEKAQQKDERPVGTDWEN